MRQHIDHIFWWVHFDYKWNDAYPDAPSWYNRACSSRLPSSIDHQPNNLIPWIDRSDLGRKWHAYGNSTRFLPHFFEKFEH